MNTTLAEVDLIDLIPTITELVNCYYDAPYAERDVIHDQIYGTYTLELAVVIEWTVRTLSTPNRTAQVTELLACALCGFGLPLSHHNRQICP